MRGRTVVKIGVVVVVAAVVAAAAMLMSIDANQYKGVIVAKVQEATGRDLVIDGDLEMVIGLTPSVRAQGVRFGNAEWGSDPHMLAVETFEAQVALLPALRGDLQVKRLVLDGAAIFLETDVKGRGNWDVLPKESGSAAASGGEALRLPSLEEVRIENARLVLKEDGNVLTTLAVERLDLSSDGYDAPLTVALTGAYNAVPFDMQGVLGPVARLQSTDGAPYPVALRGTLGGITLAADGAVAEPFAARGIDLAVKAEGRDLAGLRPLAAGLPDVPPFDLRGRVKGGDGVWTLSDLTLKAGRSAAAGTVAADLTRARPLVKASLQAALLDLGELLPEEGDEAAPSKDATPRDRVFPSDPLPLEALKAVDGEFDIEVARLVLPDGVVLEGLGARGGLKSGRLALDPVQARLGGGIVKGKVVADAFSGRALNLAVDLAGDDVVLGVLFADMARSDLLTGAQTDVAVKLSGTGSSVAGLMGSLDGTVRISVGEGRINQALIDWAGADVLNQLSDLLDPTTGRQDYADLVCAAVNLRAQRGVIEYDRAIALETTRMSVVSSGAVDLGAEKLDVAVRPYPKDGIGISAGRLAEMVRLRGSLADPKVTPDAVGVARTAVSVVGALATGGASLVAESLYDRSTADPAPCATALAGPSAAPAASAPAQQPAGPLDAPAKAIQDLGGSLQRGLDRMFSR